MGYRAIKERREMSEPTICEFLRQWAIIGNAVLAILQVVIGAIADMSNKEQ